MEISDEVAALAINAAEKKYTCVQISLPAMKEALQAAIPLVVEGLVNSSYERCDPEKMGCMRDYSEGQNDLADAILAKVKK